MKKLSSFILTFGVALSIALSSVPAYSAIDVYQFDNEQQEQQYRGLIDEFRCPKCQNQNLASSDSIISIDLKKKTYEMVKEGKKDNEIREYMLERYGDFITYNPPVRPSTYILWYFPPILLLFAIGFWLYKNANKKNVNNAKKGSSTTLLADSLPKLPLDIDTLSLNEAKQLQAILAKHDLAKDDVVKDKKEGK